MAAVKLIYLPDVSIRRLYTITGLMNPFSATAVNHFHSGLNINFKFPFISYTPFISGLYCKKCFGTFDSYADGAIRVGRYICLPMEARGVIRGIVRDSINNDGLPFASIRIDDNKTTTLTDARGLFEIAVPDNASRINVYCQGYASKSIALRNTVLNLYDIALSPASESLEELVVRRK